MEKKLVRIADTVLDLEPYAVSGELDPSLGNDPEFLKLNENETTIKPSTAAIDAINDYLIGRSLSWYPDSDSKELNDKLSFYTGLPADHISCFPGGEAALENLIRAYLEPGTEMMVVTPISPYIRNVAGNTGARLIEVVHNDPLSPSIETVIDNINRRTRLIYIGNPSDITGAMFSEAELIFLLAYAERSMVVVDETSFEFTGFSASELIRRFPNLAVTRSFSRGFGLASLRIGYLLTDPDNLKFSNKLKSPKSVNAIAQIAASAVLENLDFMKQFVAGVKDSSRFLENNLPELGYEYKISRANFFLLRVSDAGGAIGFLRENGILACDLSKYNQMDGFIRITIGTPSQMDRLILILSRMAKLFATGYNRNRIEQNQSVKIDKAKEHAIVNE